ncbi:SIMPL domain-containing protein [Aureibaculum sp. A20]|uniref:SIMPL domain-containing protein n=1 Tax=Aureibaculum flavum TaxID=2795986 RepID=A0ABS0WPC5_9FLAO|nr:SIMPL domain-containing protein [Aureibaculum flavum]MBJ2173779.1 SIMPL domain-containing protein [Aureibaculum flavum]
MKTLLTILLLTTTICFSQTGFIEIEVRDTIKIKPESFDYQISVDESTLRDYNNTGPYDPRISNEKLKLKLKELESFLKEKTTNFTPLQHSTYEVNNTSYFAKNGFMVTFTSAKDLQKFMHELKILDYVNGNLGEFHYTNEEKSEERLFKKLLDKAEKKAMTIAKLSNLKLGKLIEFSEVADVDNLTFNMLDMYTVMKGNKKWNSSNNELYGQRSKAIIVKFSAK